MTSSFTSLLHGVDAAVGDGVEAAVRAKHRRRLHKLGWSRALEPPDDRLWAAGEPVPRPGCLLDPLIDGAEAFPAIAEAIDQARDFIHITGWHVAPHFQLERDENPAALGVLLAEAAERIPVRVLVWAGAPVPAFHPTRKEVRETIEKLTSRTKIQCQRDPREHPFHCHHEKTSSSTARSPSSAGSTSPTSAATGTTARATRAARPRLARRRPRLRGPAVADVADALPHALARAHRRRAAGAAAADGRGRAHGAGRAHGRPSDIYDSVPRGDFRILESYVRAIARPRATHLLGEPVPVVARDRRRAGGQAARPAVRATSGS